MLTSLAPRAVSGLAHLDDFSRHRGRLPGAGEPTIERLRDAAFERFAATGFPGLHDEDWKYTRLSPIANGAFSLAAADAHDGDEGDVGDGNPLDAALIERLSLAGAHRLVFIDGRYCPRYSRLEALPAAATVASIGWLLDNDAERIAPCLRQAVASTSAINEPASALAALNLACLADGAYLEIAAGAQIEAPIELLYLSRSEGLAAHTRNIVVAGEDSRVVIVEQHAGVGGTRYFTHSVSELKLARGARVTHHQLQHESAKAFHLARIEAALEAGSHFASTSCAFGAALSRTDISVAFAGENASCALDGLYLADGRRHVDHHTRVDHAVAGCVSREFYKGIVGGAARAVFNGKIVVHPDAQRSDAAQTNRNLLLSDHAEIDTKPQLEIWADDVKCSHAATVGRLDAEQVFYLRSRGIDEAAARELLTAAFAAEVVERIELAPLCERVEKLLNDELARTLMVLT